MTFEEMSREEVAILINTAKSFHVSYVIHCCGWLMAFVQFQLWKSCSNNCKFCSDLGIKNNPSEKLKLIDFTISKLKALDNTNEIGLIGGELFEEYQLIENSDVYYKFFELINLISVKNYSKIYITSNLLYKDLFYIRKCIDIFKANNQLHKVLLCTSYDSQYRFHNENALNLWKNNITKLKDIYSDELKIHVEMILTEHLANNIIENKLNFRSDILDLFDGVDFIEPQCNTRYPNKQNIQIGLPGFLIKKSTLIKFLNYLKENQLYEILENLFNYNNHSDILYTMDMHYNIIEITRGVNEYENKMTRVWSVSGREFHPGLLDYKNTSIKDIVDVYKNTIL